MESEKVKEIKKALEQNDDNGIMYEVNDQKRTCKFIHHKDILTLINELESENETFSKSFENAINQINKLKDRIAELEKEIKEKALKQFAERLKEVVSDLAFKTGTVGFDGYQSCSAVNPNSVIEQIDETLKEFINE